MLKNVNLQTKPKITISISEVLEAWCRYVFDTPISQKEIILRRTHAIGKLIYSKVSVSYVPVKKSCLDRQVTIILPVHNTNHHALKNHFLHIDNFAQEQIQDGLDYEFRKWIQQRFERGYEKGFDQKQIIEAILRGLNLRNNAANFDAIKKNDYRNRRRSEEKRFKELLTLCICE